MHANRIKLACLISVFLFSSLLAVVEQSHARKFKIAIGELDALGVGETLAQITSELLRTELFKTGYFEVTERKQMEKIMKEQEFQLSGATQEDIVKIGNLLAVELIVMGSISRLGKRLFISIRLVDVEEARVRGAEKVDALGEEEIPEALEILAKNISKAIPLRGKVVEFERDMDEVIINLGRLDQMEKGRKLLVQRLGKLYKDESTGEIYGRSRIEVAVVEIRNVMGKSLSSASILKEYKDIQVGDIVVIWEGTAEEILKPKPKAKEIREERAEAERLERQRLEAEAERLERERLEAEAERLERERREAEGERLKRERRELERLKAEIEREKLEVERKRLEAEKKKLELAKLPPEPKYTPPVSKPKDVAHDGTFIAYASGVVRDTKTGLEWIAGPDRNTTWYTAKSWVESLSIDGGGWRMPTREELKSLYQKGAGKRNMTPLLKTTGWFVWSGETYTYRSSPGTSPSSPATNNGSWPGSPATPTSSAGPLRCVPVDDLII